MSDARDMPIHSNTYSNKWRHFLDARLSWTQIHWWRTWQQNHVYPMYSGYPPDIQSFSSTILLFSKENFSFIFFAVLVVVRIFRASSLVDLKTLKLCEVSPANQSFLQLTSLKFQQWNDLRPLQARILKHTVLCILVQQKYSEINDQYIIWKWWKIVKSWKWSSSQGLCFNWEAMFSWFKKNNLSMGAAARQWVPWRIYFRGTGGSIDQCVAAGWS